MLSTGPDTNKTEGSINQTKKMFAINGGIMLLVILIILIGGLGYSFTNEGTSAVVTPSMPNSYAYIAYATHSSNSYTPMSNIIVGSITAILAIFLMFGFFISRPYESKLSNLFGGTFNGTFNSEGFYWTNPLNSLTSIDLAIRNGETNMMKITEKNGNPLDIAFVYKWRVTDSYKAVFKVKDFHSYIIVQSEAIGRKIIKKHTYNDMLEKDDVIKEIEKALIEEMKPFGIEVLDCEFSALSYSKEISSAMLQKQQAKAKIEAKEEIAEGAVDIIKNIKAKMAKEEIKLEKEDESKMISQLMVVILSTESVQPMLDVG